jgi:hypothetical protein
MSKHLALEAHGLGSIYIQQLALAMKNKDDVSPVTV